MQSTEKRVFQLERVARAKALRRHRAGVFQSRKNTSMAETEAPELSDFPEDLGS